MELKDLTPREVSFEIGLPSHETKGLFAKKELTLTFRPFTLADEQWLDRRWTKEEVAEIFMHFKGKEISEIIWNQLTKDSKEKVFSIKFLDKDEDNNEIELYKKGPEKVGALLTGLYELKIALDALIQCRGFSMPVIERIAEEQGKLMAQR